MGWNDDKVEQLKKLWAEGLSASQIASRLGGVTRNAVCAKVHRLGLSGRATTSRMKSHRPRLSSSQRPKQNKIHKSAAQTPSNGVRKAESSSTFAPQQILTPREMAIFPEELVIPLSERKSLDALQDCNCRWPIGDPQANDFHFCGKQKAQGLPYCEFHSRRAFQPEKVKKRQDRYNERILEKI